MNPRQSTKAITPMNSLMKTAALALGLALWSPVLTAQPAQEAPQPPAAAAPAEASKVVLKVNGQEITAAQFNRVLQQMRAQPSPPMVQQEPPTMEEAQAELERQARERLIGQALFTQALEQKSPTIPDVEVDARLSQFEQEVAASGMQIDDMLEQAGKTREDLRQEVRQDLAVQALVEEHMGDQDPSEEELRQLFDQVADQLNRPEQIQTRQIFVAFTDDGTTPTEERKQTARQRADEAFKRLKAGEDFVKVFDELSTPMPAAGEGGEFPFHARGELPPPLDDAAWALKPGELSEVLESEYGFHIIQLEEHREAAPASFEEHRDALARHQLQQNIMINVPLTALELRKTAKIEMLDEATGEFVPAPAAAEPTAEGEPVNEN